MQIEEEIEASNRMKMPQELNIDHDATIKTEVLQLLLHTKRSQKMIRATGSKKILINCNAEN